MTLPLVVTKSSMTAARRWSLWLLPSHLHRPLTKSLPVNTVTVSHGEPGMSRPPYCLELTRTSLPFSGDGLVEPVLVFAQGAI